VRAAVQRIAQIITLKPEAIQEYKRVHAAVWPGVLAQIAGSKIKNYSIFLREPENLLFAYFEYHGEDYAADMARMAEDHRPHAAATGDGGRRPVVGAGRRGLPHRLKLAGPQAALS
jgi:L-rhamnose mutarotase